MGTHLSWQRLEEAERGPWIAIVVMLPWLCYVKCDIRWGSQETEKLLEETQIGFLNYDEVGQEENKEMGLFRRKLKSHGLKSYWKTN